MDGNSSLERRYSFNMAQGNPVAESTHLNASSFSWGTSISPNHRSNSSFCLNNIHTTLDSNNRLIAVSPKSKNVSKIDARIAADVQSKGLASRIVKYHESGTRLNRSMSAHNLYTRPGQFPVVTLKKTDLPYRATKQELSMIRIPPPEKSSFYGNTISSLLRSSSVVGLQSKRSEDLSRENRPIIHPPPTEDDMAPTRSVLDVLKEISRKRINSDDLEADETSKKYCNRAGNDFVDIGNNTAGVISSSFTTAPSSLSCQRYKRQRDCISSHQNVQMTETKSSPEQAKKRVCNYNNDITSSLSSSIKCKPHGSAKRISVSHNLNQTMPTNLESYEIQKAKMQRYLDNHNNDKNNTRVDVRLENLENNLRKLDTLKPISPIPATPGTQDQQCNTGGVPPKRTVSEPLYNPERKILTNSIPPANKPRLTLFNKKCDDEESTAANESNETVVENASDFDEFAGIPFVKPKKISSISGLRNPVIERTQKSKLALMLSGLRGELYQNSDADELDSSKEKHTTADIKINTSTNAITSSLKSNTTTIATITTVTSSNNVGTPIISSTLSTNNKTTSSTPSLNASINKTSSPLVGLKLSQPSSENVISTLNNNPPKSTEALSITNVPVLGGFSFGTITTTTSSSPSVNTKTSNSTPKDSKTPVAPTSSISTTTSNVINIITSTQSPSSASDKLTINIQPSAKDNSQHFPTVSAAFTQSTNNSTASNTTNSLKTTNAFTFGTKVAATASSSSAPKQVSGLTLLNNTEKTSNAFNFTVPSTSSSVTTPLFGTLTSATPQTSITSSCIATTTSCPTFGTVSASTNSTAITSTFTFNASKPTTTTSEETTVSSGSGGNSFTFGSNTAPPVSTFGTNTNAGVKTQTTSSGFTFNSDTKIQNSSLSDQNKTETNIFNFGSPSLKTPSTTAGSAPIFGNDNKSTSQTTSLFGSNAVKAGTPTFGSIVESKTATMSTNSVFGAAVSTSSTPTFGSSSENKSAVMATTSIFGAATSNSSTPTFGSSSESKSAPMASSTAFGGGNSNNSTSTPFSFGSKLAIAQTTNTNNSNAATGGFSFGSVAANSSDSGPFAFGIKTGVTTNTSSNTFSGASTSTTQNKNFSFGSSANKSDNPPNVFGGGVNKPTENMASAGGFSFGSAMSPKAATFSFGAGSNSFPGGNVSNTNSSATGFSFGGATVLKPNEVSTNKPFSFGSPQTSQQQQQQLAANNNANSSNIFGSNATNKTVPPPAFNFNSGSSTNAQSNTPTTNNIFDPPSASTITTGRPIRRATRRLQK